MHQSNTRNPINFPQPVAERFEAMHAKGDVWITTIAAAALARNTAPPRQPLTDEQIRKAFYDSDDGQETQEYIIAFARAIEAAHNIKEQQ